jgi:hypothetical protein
VAALERQFGRGAVRVVAAGEDLTPAPAPKPPPEPRPRAQVLAEREAHLRRRLAKLEGSRDQEASFDRAALRHQLGLIDAERRGAPPPEFGGHAFAESGPHRFAGTAHKPAGTPVGGEFTSGPGGGGAVPGKAKAGAGPAPGAGKPAGTKANNLVASPAELKAAQSKARAKFAAAPVPTAEAIAAAGARMDAEGADRYEANIRGNTKDRAASRAKLVAEFSTDGGKTCPCVYCGIKLVPEPEDGPNTVTRDKMYTARQGGRYNLANLAPACLACNKSRSDTPFSEAVTKWK